MELMSVNMIDLTIKLTIKLTITQRKTTQRNTKARKLFDFDKDGTTLELYFGHCREVA
jgi:hypothetical protein